MQVLKLELLETNIERHGLTRGMLTRVTTEACLHARRNGGRIYTDLCKGIICLQRNVTPLHGFSAKDNQLESRGVIPIAEDAGLASWVQRLELHTLRTA